jgi:hypothetical protein
MVSQILKDKMENTDSNPSRPLRRQRLVGRRSEHMQGRHTNLVLAQMLH